MEQKGSDDCDQGRERVMEHHTHTEIKPVGEIIMIWSMFMFVSSPVPYIPSIKE